MIPTNEYFFNQRLMALKMGLSCLTIFIFDFVYIGFFARFPFFLSLVLSLFLSLFLSQSLYPCSTLSFFGSLCLAVSGIIFICLRLSVSDLFFVCFIYVFDSIPVSISLSMSLVFYFVVSFYLCLNLSTV